jgi:protein-tyrosine kinase
MSANADVLRRSDLVGSPAQETELRRPQIPRESNDWNPQDFAREQIRSLVRRVFFASGVQPVKQVVFCAADPNTDVAGICDQVGRALALETRADIALMGREPRVDQMFRSYFHYGKSSAIKSRSTQAATNLWLVPEFGVREYAGQSGTGPYWVSCLAALRNEFEYAVIQGPVAGTSSEAALLGQLADGIVLVLGANSTRKATARKIMETLEAAQSRILGTVLSERKFPVPNRIYRRL